MLLRTKAFGVPDVGTTSLERRSWNPLEFWRMTLEELDAVEARPQLAYVDQFSRADVVVYNLSFQSLDDVRVAGWLALPRQPGQPRCPGLLTAPGYVADPAIPVEWATRGYAALSLAYRGKAGAGLASARASRATSSKGSARPTPLSIGVIWTPYARLTSCPRSPA